MPLLAVTVQLTTPPAVGVPAIVALAPLVYENVRPACNVHPVSVIDVTVGVPLVVIVKVCAVPSRNVTLFGVRNIGPWLIWIVTLPSDVPCELVVSYWNV